MSKSRVYKTEQAVKSAIKKMRSEALFGLHQDGYDQEKAEAISWNLERLERFLLAQLKEDASDLQTSQDEAPVEDRWLGEDNVPKKPVGGWSW